MAEEKKISLLGSIAKSIKSKMSLGSSPKPEEASADATAENKQSVENIDFEQIKSSFMNIEGSVNKLNEIFEGINTNLRAVLDKNKQQEYSDEENKLEGKPKLEPRGREDDKRDKPSFWDNLKKLFLNPAVIAALAGLIYFILPKETQERIKAILGGFADGVDKSTDGFSKLSTTTKVVGIGLVTYLGAKLLKNVVDAITSVMGMIKAIGRMGKFGKAAAIGALGATAFAVTKTYMAVTGKPEEEEPVTEKTAERETNISSEADKTSTILTKEEVVPTGKEADKTSEAKSENVTMSGQAVPAAAGGATAEAKPAPSASQPASTAPQASTPAPVTGAPAAAPMSAAPTRAQRMEAAARGETVLPSAPPVVTPSATPTIITPASKTSVYKPSVAATAPSTTKDGKLLIPSETVGKAIESASKRVGVDQSIMMAMAKQESGFNPQAKAGTSSATGLFQFISSTWNSMVQKYSGSYPELHRGPMDVDASSIAGALYIKENSNFLKQNNIPVNGTTIYASHFLGAGGARTLLSSPPNAIAANIMPKAAAANKNIFYRNDGSARTIAEVQEVLYNKVGKEAEKYAALNSNTPTQVAMAPTPVPTTPTQVAMAPKPVPVTVAALQATPAPVAAPTESPKASKGVQIASLSTKNEAMASPKPMAPQIQNASSTKNVGVNGNSGKATPNEIPIPIANRGSLSGNVRHATQYA